MLVVLCCVSFTAYLLCSFCAVELQLAMSLCVFTCLSVVLVTLLQVSASYNERCFSGIFMPERLITSST